MELLTTILSNTYTKGNLLHRISLLREFLEFMFFTPHKNENLIFLLNEFFISKKESRDEFNALNSWGYDFFSQFNKENVYKKLSEIEEPAKNLPEIVVYLPVELPIYEVPKLGTWFRQNVSETLIIDTKVDHSLIGGCALAYRGKYKDYSLRFYLNKNRAAVKKIIEDYLELRLSRQKSPRGGSRENPPSSGISP